MRVGVLFSGGKDSTYAAWLTKKAGHQIECLITLQSENKDSFMFHTPAIEFAKKQEELMKIPIIIRETKGEKELELKDLKRVIEKAKIKQNIQGIVTGAVESVYQSSRIQKICNELDLECFNPLWQKDQEELLNDLIKNGFEAVISGVSAYPLDRKWLGRKINKEFIEKIKEMNRKYSISIAGEGGEFESFVINCPMFKNHIKIKDMQILGEGNSWRAQFSI